ncbi:hypothetical protein SK128_007197 [Halocaridina rubra]|uniref:Reelin domain-containing protein n=1 Tax=Halocaridina rubra TaxID=373956 RepID=A0AAN8WFU8_HALRR
MAKTFSNVAKAVALLIFCLAVSVSGMSDHVPEAACQSMVPLGHNAQAQTSSPPYVLKVPQGRVPIGSEVNVVVAGMNPQIMFKGFFIKAFDQSTGQPIGSFTKAPKTINCDGTASGAHHAGPHLKESEVLAWSPPPNFKGSVIFMATIVMERTVFWTNVVSSPLVFA